MTINIYIKENNWIAKIAAAKLKSPAVAMVIGRTIHLYGVDKAEFLSDSRWLRHELEHVLQYKRHGKFYFLWLYIFYSIKYGYYNNPLEKEARIAEKDVELNKQIVIKA